MCQTNLQRTQVEIPINRCLKIRDLVVGLILTSTSFRKRQKRRETEKTVNLILFYSVKISLYTLSDIYTTTHEVKKITNNK